MSLTSKTRALRMLVMDTIKEAAKLLGSRGRNRNTERQAQASRQNGKLGGRPKKSENSSCISQAPRIISPQDNAVNQQKKG